MTFYWDTHTYRLIWFNNVQNTVKIVSIIPQNVRYNFTGITE